MSQSATPATQNNMTTCVATFEKKRFCSFPHRRGEATGKPETPDKTRRRSKTSISCETSSNFVTFDTVWNRLECHKVPRLPRKTTWQPAWQHVVRKGSDWTREIAILLLLAIEPHFARKGCDGNLEFAILPQFLAIKAHFVRKGCVSCRLVGTAPRLQERNRKEGDSKRAREQQGKRECEDEKMWGCEDEKMWRCEDVKMWGWEDMKMRRCEDERMWGWEDVKTRRCEDEQMWRWEDVRMWRWEDVRMRRCEDVRMRGCEEEKMWRWADVKMWRCEDVKMRRCEDVKMWGWEDVKKRKCEDERMWRWEDLKMRRCKDKKMRRCLTDPTIGRTLRPDALGKKVPYAKKLGTGIYSACPLTMHMRHLLILDLFLPATPCTTLEHLPYKCICTHTYPCWFHAVRCR